MEEARANSKTGRPRWTLLELCSRGLLQVLGPPNPPSPQLVRRGATRDTCRAAFRPPSPLCSSAADSGAAPPRQKPHDGIQTTTVVGLVTSPTIEARPHRPPSQGAVRGGATSRPGPKACDFRSDATVKVRRNGSPRASEGCCAWIQVNGSSPFGWT